MALLKHGSLCIFFYQNSFNYTFVLYTCFLPFWRINMYSYMYICMYICFPHHSPCLYSRLTGVWVVCRRFIFCFYFFSTTFPYAPVPSMSIQSLIFCPSSCHFRIMLSIFYCIAFAVFVVFLVIFVFLSVCYMYVHTMWAWIAICIFIYK